MTRVVIPPVTLELDGAKVYILEVSEHETLSREKRFIISCIVEYNNYRSQIFQLDVANNDELKAKLRLEISKMKLMILSNMTHCFERIK